MNPEASCCEAPVLRTAKKYEITEIPCQHNLPEILASCQLVTISSYYLQSNKMSDLHLFRLQQVMLQFHNIQILITEDKSAHFQVHILSLLCALLPPFNLFDVFLVHIPNMGS